MRQKDLKEMNEMDYGLKKLNNNMTKTEVMWGWVMMSCSKMWFKQIWWACSDMTGVKWSLSVMKSITEQQRDY